MSSFSVPIECNCGVNLSNRYLAYKKLIDKEGSENNFKILKYVLIKPKICCMKSLVSAYDMDKVI